MTDAARRAAFGVGHWTNAEARTGCTVILFDRLVPAVVDVRGGAPGTRETDLLNSDRMVGRVDAILLTGGSAHGLAAAEGVMQYLRERKRGFPTAAGPVPIVTGAVIYDLEFGESVWPIADNGYAACQAAADIAVSGSGRIGAGTGATTGKLWPSREPGRGGYGWARVEVSSSDAVYAMAVVNSVGDVVTAEWRDGRELLLAQASPLDERSATTLVTIVIDSDADQRTLRRVAVSGHDAIGRAIVPAHTLWDGDLVYVAQTGGQIEVAQPDALRLTIAAELAVERAIRAAVTS